MLDHFHKLLYSSVSDHVHILLYGGFLFLLLKTCSPTAWMYVAPLRLVCLYLYWCEFDDVLLRGCYENENITKISGKVVTK